MTTSQGPADPVRGLLHQHRELCARAVDPLEIAAVLEARGVTDRTAARFKHRDVFSLAEELYARTPHTDAGAMAEVMGQASATGAGRPVRAVALLSPLLPGALCAATLCMLALVRGTPPYARLAVAAVGAVAVCAGVRLALRALPVGLPKTVVLWGCWLLGYALFGDRLLGELLGGGPEIPSITTLALPTGVALTLALAAAPALWCARGFALGALRRLAGSRSLEEFSAGVRPLLAFTVALFVGCLLALQWAVGALDSVWDGALHAVVGAVGADESGGLTPSACAATASLGLLLFASLLLSAHGFGGAASAGLVAACAVEITALSSVLAARLPGLGWLGRPVERAVALLGAPAVPLTACGCAALGLLAYASMTLTGASAHHRAAAHT